MGLHFTSGPNRAAHSPCLRTLEERNGRPVSHRATRGDRCALVRPLDAAFLNRAPPTPETNSIATIIVHTIGSTYSQLSRALDELYVRDRDAEFHARDDAETTLALLADSRERISGRSSPASLP